MVCNKLWKYFLFTDYIPDITHQGIINIVIDSWSGCLLSMEVLPHENLTTTVDHPTHGQHFRDRNVGNDVTRNQNWHLTAALQIISLTVSKEYICVCRGTVNVIFRAVT